MVMGGYKCLRRLQGVTGGFKGLQEITRNYKGVTGGVDGVTTGYSWLQEVTGDYKG